MKRQLYMLLCCWLISAAVSSVFGSAHAQSPSSRPYVPDQPVEGELHLVGSSTMGQLAALWADGFRRLHPNTTIVINCSGSEITAPELQHSPNVIGLVSRPITPVLAASDTPHESSGAITADNSTETPEANSQPLIALMVCRDPVAVITHPGNPLPSLVWDANDQQILSADFRPLAESLFTAGIWGQLGLEGEWEKRTVIVHAPQQGHGTRVVLEQWMLDLQPSNSTVSREPEKPKDPTVIPTKYQLQEHAERSSLISAVAADKAAIGIASLSLGGLDNVRTVPIGVAGKSAVMPSPESIDDGSYSLVRPLFFVIHDDGSLLKTRPLVLEFIRYVLSDFGQLDVIKDGFTPLNRSELLLQMEKISGEVVR